MNAIGFVAVGCGAALGAWVRWLLGLALNPLLLALPLGTLAANLIGGYLVGVAVGLFHLNTHFPLAWKLLGVACLNQGQLEQSEQALMQARQQAAQAPSPPAPPAGAPIPPGFQPLPAVQPASHQAEGLPRGYPTAAGPIAP